MKHKPILVFLFILLAGKTFSQDQSHTANVSTVDGIIHALYDVISGPVGEERDWDTFRSLFAPDARMYIAVPGKNGGVSSLQSITPDEYITRNQTRLPDIGFNEDELYRITNTYGAGSQVFSTYESHYTNKDGEQEITKGINNIQLYFDGTRYYIASIFWDANAKNIEVPERYLPKNRNTEYQINLQ
ncbi:hypothetical protein [Parafilimonas sp.]|uniref:hypothetical protein n=1 Tax=Parafilimonas sp. TaxID=1969739 RepID=UPI0039E5148D